MQLLQAPGPKALTRVPTSRPSVLGSPDLSGKVPLLRGKINIPDSYPFVQSVDLETEAIVVRGRVLRERDRFL